MLQMHKYTMYMYKLISPLILAYPEYFCNTILELMVFNSLSC